MSYIPQSLADERAVWRQETGLSLNSLGILHYSPQGGGYHEGNDLLAQAGRLHTDYSKRESDRDRPGTDAGSAIDIGDFNVEVTRVDGSRRWVNLRDYTRWLLAQLAAGAPDVAFVRELIYSLDGVTVKRWDRLGIRSSGDSSHLTHNHRSDFRDNENADKAAHVRRFWREMRGVPAGVQGNGDDDMAWLFNVTNDKTPGAIYLCENHMRYRHVTGAEYDALKKSLHDNGRFPDMKAAVNVTYPNWDSAPVGYFVPDPDTPSA